MEVQLWGHGSQTRGPTLQQDDGGAIHQGATLGRSRPPQVPRDGSVTGDPTRVSEELSRPSIVHAESWHPTSGSCPRPALVDP